MLRRLKIRCILAVAKVLAVPIKIRDIAFGAEIGCSHMSLEPVRTLFVESGPG
jgi:hypothetical protein